MKLYLISAFLGFFLVGAVSAQDFTFNDPDLDEAAHWYREAVSLREPLAEISEEKKELDPEFNDAVRDARKNTEAVAAWVTPQAQIEQTGNAFVGAIGGIGDVLLDPLFLSILGTFGLGAGAIGINKGRKEKKRRKTVEAKLGPLSAKISTSTGQDIPRDGVISADYEEPRRQQYKPRRSITKDGVLPADYEAVSSGNGSGVFTQPKKLQPGYSMQPEIADAIARTVIEKAAARPAESN